MAVGGVARARRFWVDPRFVIGVGLVVVSVLGVGAVVTAADDGVRVYAARAALSPGDRVAEADLVERTVRLGEAAGKYLTRRDLPGGGLVVTRAVAAGELVPASAVGDGAGVRLASVVVAMHGQLPRSVGPAAVVDLWSARATDAEDYGPPSVLVSGATVVRVIEQDGIVAGSGESVEVLVPRPRIARVLEAIADEDAISLVPAGIPARG